jgi:hypothetical protein
MASDRLDPAGFYFGTTGGTVFASADEGRNWQPVVQHLPAIRAIETLVMAG